MLFFLSGERRGSCERLSAETLRIGSAAEYEIRLGAAVHGTTDDTLYATLHRSGATYELEVAPGREVWLNGQRVETAQLASGDLLELDEQGTVLRFRLHEPAHPNYKSVAEAFSDSVECAQHERRGVLSRVSRFTAEVASELVTQTSFWFRGGLLVLVSLLIVSVVALAYHSVWLDRQLIRERELIDGISDVLERVEKRVLTAKDLAGLRIELEGYLSETTARLEALESLSAAGKRVISATSGSVVFLLGSYGFVEPHSDEPLRYLEVGTEGEVLSTPRGQNLVGFGGSGPLVETHFTGTAFVVSDDGLLLTNRHVAMPWEEEPSVQTAIAQGLKPFMHRFIGYIPGATEPFAVQLEQFSDSADLAVLRSEDVRGRVSPLELSRTPPQPGDEVIVMGYPTGIHALLARAERSFFERIEDRELDFWTLVGELAREGRITPLANRGIVGQVTKAAVVYDAPTTRGGSGGPVLGLDGKVVAINSAIVPDFTGSNLGVPARYGQLLLSQSPSPRGAL